MEAEEAAGRVHGWARPALVGLLRATALVAAVVDATEARSIAVVQLVQWEESQEEPQGKHPGRRLATEEEMPKEGCRGD